MCIQTSSERKIEMSCSQKIGKFIFSGLWYLFFLLFYRRGKISWPPASWLRRRQGGGSVSVLRWTLMTSRCHSIKTFRRSPWSLTLLTERWKPVWDQNNTDAQISLLAKENTINFAHFWVRDLHRPQFLLSEKTNNFYQADNKIDKTIIYKS